MLKISKKFLSVLLVVIMVCSVFTIVPFTVSAYANIDEYPDFDVDVYVAGLMTDSDNPLYRTIDNQISLDSPNDVVIKQLKSDVTFQASYAAWQIATFKGGDTVTDPLTEVGYYQSVILDTISEALTSSVVKNAFDNTVIKEAKHIQSTFTNILKLDFVFTDLDDLNVAEMTQAEQIKVIDDFSSAFKKTFPAVSDFGKFVSVFSTIVKEGKALETAINHLAAYTESVGMNEYMKAVVSDLYKNCDSSNTAMKSALFEINSACQSYELAYTASIFDAASSSLSIVCEKVVNTMFDGIMAANPAGLSVMIGQAIGKGVANFLFSTDAICEQYYKMCCLYEFEELLGKVTKLEMNSFSNSKTNYNANKIFSAVDFLYKEYDVSCDLAKKYADIIFKESIAGVFVLNSDGYNNYISLVESMRSIAENEYEFLHGEAWTYFLEEDYPDIYEALIKEDEEIKNPYIPVTDIAFEKESVEWGTQDTFLNYDKATITPSNASSQGIEYTSSDKSVVSYNKYGAVVHKTGRATITATSVSSGLTATLNVTVVDGKGADGIAIEDPNPDNKISYGDIFTVGNNKYKVTSIRGTVGVISGTPNANGVVTIPETVGYKNKLFSVTSVIDGSMKGAGAAQGAFTNGGSYSYRNTSVKKVILPNTITYVGRYAFCYCRNLQSVEFPEGVVSLGYALFDYSGVKSVTIPQSLKSLGGCGASGNTFYNNGFLVRTVYYYGSRDNWENLSDASGDYYGLKDVAKLYILHVHRYSSAITKKPTYTETGERTFTCVCGDSYTEVIDKLPIEILYGGKCGDDVYWTLDSVGLLSILGKGNMYDSSYSDIPWNSIRDEIKTVEITDGVTSIGEYAFTYCKSLEYVAIPDSVTSILNKAFYGCSNLTTIYGYTGSCAERFAESNNIKFISIGNVVNDAETEISVTIKNDAELSVKRLIDGEIINKANTILESSEKLDSLFDISLVKDGEPVQPDGTVTVKIPTDNENAKVYRIEEDGTKTDMNAVYSDGYMVFTTDHFSLYALVIPNDVDLGDVNGDGGVTIDDVTLIQKYLASMVELDSKQIKAADVTGDGDVSIDDVTKIQKFIAGLVSSLSNV